MLRMNGNAPTHPLFAEAGGSENVKPGRNSQLAGIVRGTVIKTAHGDRLVEDLRIGDLVLSQDSGHLPIVSLEITKLSRSELLKATRLWPVRICAGAFGPNIPDRDLIVAQNHLVQVTSDFAAQMTGHRQILVPAKKLFGLPGVALMVPAVRTDYFQIGLDRHEMLWTNGLLTGNPPAEPRATAAPGKRADKTVGKAGSPTVRPVIQHNSVVLPMVYQHVRSGAPLADGA